MNVYDTYKRDYISDITKSVDYLLNFQKLSMAEISRRLHIPRDKVIYERSRLSELKMLEEAIKDLDNIANLEIDLNTWRVMRRSTAGETSIAWFENHIQSDEEFLDRLHGIGSVRKYRITKAIEEYRRGDKIENSG